MKVGDERPVKCPYCSTVSNYRSGKKYCEHCGSELYISNARTGAEVEAELNYNFNQVEVLLDSYSIIEKKKIRSNRMYMFREEEKHDVEECSKNFLNNLRTLSGLERLLYENRSLFHELKKLRDVNNDSQLVETYKFLDGSLKDFINAENRRLRRITLLDLSSMGLEGIPYHLSELSGLKTLNLYDNQLESIPEGINNLKKLNVLNLNNNQLVSLQGLKDLPQLENLFLGNNQIKNLKPLKQGNFLHLKKLRLQGNQLTSVESLKGLNRLEELNLSSNQLVSVEGLGSLRNLERLYLSDNLLKSIDGVEEIPNLKKLYVRKNPLEVNWWLRRKFLSGCRIKYD